MKTDRRDPTKLARSSRAGHLTPVWVPDAAHEALRDLVRAREAAKKDQLRARHRLSTFLLRQGRRPPTGVRPWTARYLTWVRPGRAVSAAGAGRDVVATHNVFYVIGESRTYDQVFGDMERGNGDPNLALLGKNITPNVHALAREFVLFDNF